MRADIFTQLRERLNFYSIGFPQTETGVEIKILKRLFTEDEAGLFLSMSHRLEKPDSVAERIGQPLSDVAMQLEDMAGKGLVFRVKKGDAVRYAAIPFVHGLFEFQVSRLDRSLSELLEEYFQAGFLDAFNKSRGTFLRTIPVQKSLDATRNVAAFDDAAEILKKMNKIVVTNCICRKQKDLIDQSCDKPLETCFMFGSMAQYYLDHGMGREIDVDEAIRILSRCPGSRPGHPAGHGPESRRHVQLLRRLLRRAPGPQSAPQTGGNRFFQLLRRCLIAECVHRVSKPVLSAVRWMPLP